MANNTVSQTRLMAFWNCKNALMYVSQLKETAFKHHKYFCQFRKMQDLERAVYHFVVKDQIFDFKSHRYIQLSKRGLPWKN